MNPFNCRFCYHNYHQDDTDSVSCCNCCDNGEFFHPTNGGGKEIVCPYCGSLDPEEYDLEVTRDEYGNLEVVRHFCCSCEKQFVVCYTQTAYGPETA